MDRSPDIAMVIDIGRQRPLDLERTAGQGVQEMSAGLTSRSITATTVALPRTALAGLLAVVLLVGGLFGVVARSGFDTLTGTAAGASVATSGLATRMLAERAQIAVGRGPLAGDPGTGGARPAGPGHAADHIGLSERLFPITTTHHLEHGPLP